MTTRWRGDPSRASWDSIALPDPARTYVVASTPRSGSTWLSQALRDTGRLGLPAEYFDPAIMGAFYARIGVPGPTWRAKADLWWRRARGAGWRGHSAWVTRASLRSYVRWLRQHRASANGTFATKLHQHQLRTTRARVGLDLLTEVRPARVVLLTRRDHRRQAISVYRAKHTRRWHSVDVLARPAADPPFDRERLVALVERVRTEQAAWRDELADRRLPVHEICYEDLAADRDAVLAGCFAFLGEPGLPPPPSDMERMADATTEEWLDRLGPV